MLATLLSAVLVGLDGRVIRVEVDVAPGLPGFTLVGLGDVAVQEARERVRGAIRNSGFAFPPRRITVNLAPAELRKAGASLDLAIAIGVLLGSEQVRPGAGRPALVGEVSLGGEVRPVPGMLPIVAALRRRGVASVLVAMDAVHEAGLVDGLAVTGVATLAEAADVVRARRGRRTTRPRIELLTARGPFSGPDAARREGPDDRALAGGDRPSTVRPERPPDLADVRGQLEARRALEVALAGGHGLLMVGPPGVGKTLLARTIPGLLPPLDNADALAATIVASASGEGPLRRLVRRPPFRAPHHTVSYAGMIGGGPRLAPGEVSRAHGGVLFLDELPEFSRDVMEALRQPLEEGLVAVVRAGGASTFPARFQLVAAMNPCPCGLAGSTDRRCGCPPHVPARYERRISGPLRDRIDVFVRLTSVPPAALVGGSEPEPSATVAARIAAARERQRARPSGSLNARLRGRTLRAVCRLSAGVVSRAVALAELERLSGRGTERLLRVARTIADLDDSEAVRSEHLDEAARYRTPIPPEATGAAVG